jgi:hypothetical protein
LNIQEGKGENIAQEQFHRALFTNLHFLVEHFISIAKVLISETTAEKELARLNHLNANKGCVYLLMVTRLVE